MTTCVYHCRATGGHRGCGEHFSSLKAFDAHRVGTFADGRKCTPPARVAKLVELDRGRCGISPPAQTDVPIWAMAGSVEQAREAFLELPGGALPPIEAPEAVPGPKSLMETK